MYAQNKSDSLTAPQAMDFDAAVVEEAAEVAVDLPVEADSQADAVDVGCSSYCVSHGCRIVARR